jgi:hypothetical protein
MDRRWNLHRGIPIQLQYVCSARRLIRPYRLQNIYRDLEVYRTLLLSKIDVWGDTQAKNTEIAVLDLWGILHTPVHPNDIWLSPVSSHASL